MTLDGEDISTLRTHEITHRGVALCPEGRRLFVGMSIEDNLLMGALRAGRHRRQERLEECYGRFDWLARRRRELAGGLSGGEQQVVAIGRALMGRPRLLLLDEPSSGLSPVAVNQIAQMLCEVREAGTSLLLVEQNVRLAQSVCESGHILERGSVVTEGPMEKLSRSRELVESYLGSRGAEAGGKTSRA